MAYRRIPRKFDEKEILAEIGSRMRYGDLKAGSVKGLADRMGRSYENLIDILNGRHSGPVLDILHEATVETDGDPEIKKFLEPDGFRLFKATLPEPDKDCLPDELLDDLPELAKMQTVYLSKTCTQHHAKLARDRMIREIEQNYVALCRERGWIP